MVLMGVMWEIQLIREKEVKDVVVLNDGVTYGTTGEIEGLLVFTV